MQANTPNEEPDSSVKRDPANDQDSISFQLQAARTNAGISVADLSKETGISKTVLHGYERGRTKPGAREIRLLCSALKVSPNQLLFGSEDFKADASEFTSFFRKVRARPELAGLYFTMMMPAMAALLEEEEVINLFHIVSALIRARSPSTAELISAAAKASIEVLDSKTTVDGAWKGTQEDLQGMVIKAATKLQNELLNSNTNLETKQD